MDERRRFQIALGGIASSLLIAALFVSSAPPLSYPVVPRVGLDAPVNRAVYAALRPFVNGSQGQAT